MRVDEEEGSHYLSNRSASCLIPPWPGPGIVRSAAAITSRCDPSTATPRPAHAIIDASFRPSPTAPPAACVLSVPVSFGAIRCDDEQVVTVCLDVKVSLARVADHLHRKLMRDAVIEQRPTVQRADLRPLVTDDRPFEAEPLHPGKRTGKRAAGARHHRHAGGFDAVERGDVAWVEGKLHVQDGAVQVQRQKSVLEGEGYLLTSGLTMFGGRPPRTAVAMLRAAIADISERLRTVALAMCGARTTLGIEMRPGCTAGSRS